MTSRAIRDAVRSRAEERCEYCRARELPNRLRFHVEHVIALQHGGGDELENLALACHLCNAHKGPNLAGIDPETGALVPLFHPRRQDWTEHFRDDGGVVAGLTPEGRATASLLVMNNPARVELRRLASNEG